MNPDVEWSVREKLAIASFVLHSGDQHWSGSVSRMLRRLGEPDRPADWFSSKNCAQQYTALLEAADTPRRKRGERTESTESSSSISSTPSTSETIVRKLTQERVEELRKLIRAERNKYKKHKQLLDQIQSGELDDDKLDEMLEEIEEKEALEKEEASENAKENNDVPQPGAKQMLVLAEVNEVATTEDTDAASKEIVEQLPNVASNTESKPESEMQTEVSSSAESEMFPKPNTDEDVAMEAETSSELMKDINEDSFPAPPPSSQHITSSSTSVAEKEETTSSVVEKEETTSSVASSNQTLPTPTPVIESDSEEEEAAVVEEAQNPILEKIIEDVKEDVAAKDSSASQKDEEEPKDDKLEPSTTQDAESTSHLTADDQDEHLSASPVISMCPPDVPEIFPTKQIEDDKNDLSIVSEKLSVLQSDENTFETSEASTQNNTDVENTLSLETNTATSNAEITKSDAEADSQESISVPSDGQDATRAEEILPDVDRNPEKTYQAVVKPVVEVPAEKETKPKVETKTEERLVEDDTNSCKDGLSTEEEAINEKSFDLGFNTSMPSTPAYVDSFPNSPALSCASDIDPEATIQSRAWKKSIMILWKQVASHRYASLFLQPVTDDIAPNYSATVYRAMDLSTLKKHIETGVVRNTNDFQRDLMLMFQNALMYNSRGHDVYKMTIEMQNDVMDQVAQFLATQLMMETTKQSTPKGLRRSTLRKSVMSEKGSESRSKR